MFLVQTWNTGDFIFYYLISKCDKQKCDQSQLTAVGVNLETITCKIILCIIDIQSWIKINNNTIKKSNKNTNNLICLQKQIFQKHFWNNKEHMRMVRWVRVHLPVIITSFCLIHYYYNIIKMIYVLYTAITIIIIIIICDILSSSALYQS